MESTTIHDFTTPRLAELRAEYAQAQKQLAQCEQARNQLMMQVVGLEHTIQYLERLEGGPTMVTAQANGQGG